MGKGVPLGKGRNMGTTRISHWEQKRAAREKKSLQGALAVDVAEDGLGSEFGDVTGVDSLPGGFTRAERSADTGVDDAEDAGHGIFADALEVGPAQSREAQVGIRDSRSSVLLLWMEGM